MCITRATPGDVALSLGMAFGAGASVARGALSVFAALALHTNCASSLGFSDVSPCSPLAVGERSLHTPSHASLGTLWAIFLFASNLDAVFLAPKVLPTFAANCMEATWSFIAFAA